MRSAINARREEDDEIGSSWIHQEIRWKIALLDMPEEMAERYKRRLLSGRINVARFFSINDWTNIHAILDEIDSGLLTH